MGRRCVYAATVSLLAAVCFPLSQAFAIFEKGDNWPWKVKVHSWQEADMQQKLGDCWYLNVGPTGIRAQITHENPCYFTVRYVFAKSPADGKIKPDDIIVGANGKMLERPHQFGRLRVAGWDGPLVDMAELIEDSQGKDGKLDLMVWPGGKKGDQKTVTIQIKPVGRFSPTYPFDCPRSEKLVEELCDFLVTQYEREGGFHKNVHTHSHCVLALMASGNKKYDSLIKKVMAGYANKRYDPNQEAGFPCWGWGYDGIVMGEYYLRTKDKSLLPAMKSLAECYELAQDWRNGGNSHKPFPAIEQRIAAGGPKGYGPMAGPGALAMLAMSLFKEGGLFYSERAYERTHQSYLQAAAADRVNIVYTFPAWTHAVIEVKDASRGKSGKGIGYLCQDGMKNIGEYTITWPTQDDPRWKPTDWVAAEADKNAVFEAGNNSRMVVRTMTLPEPEGPYKTTRFCSEAPVGLGALAHIIGNRETQSWQWLGQHCAMSCALGPREWLQGHASSSMHQLWVALGAARADEKAFRSFLDQVKWWFIMQECHDGGYFILPDRDRDTNGDPHYGARNLPTANAAIIFALPRHSLQITGADSSAPVTATRPGAKSRTAVSTQKPVLRKARKLPTERIASLDKALQNTLVKMSEGGELKPVPVILSKTRAKIWLAKAGSDGTLTFQLIDGDQTAEFKMEELTTGDRVSLSVLVATLLATSKDAQAMAGVYMEAIGRVTDADSYYEKAGKESCQKFEKLFTEKEAGE